MQATVSRPKVWFVWFSHSYIKGDWSYCFLTLLKPCDLGLFFPSIDQPVVGLLNSMLEGQCVAVGVWYQESGPQVAGSLYIFGQVTACILASVFPDEEWGRLLIYEWWSKINPVLWELWEYTFLEFPSKGPACSLLKRWNVIIGATGYGDEGKKAHRSEGYRKVCSRAQNWHKQMLLLHFRWNDSEFWNFCLYRMIYGQYWTAQLQETWFCHYIVHCFIHVYVIPFFWWL